MTAPTLDRPDADRSDTSPVPDAAGSEPARSEAARSGGAGTDAAGTDAARCAGPAVPRPRVRPSREQLRVAAAMVSVSPEDVTSVVVPVVAAGLEETAAGVFPRRLEYPGGYWLADRGRQDGAYCHREAREAAIAAAEAHLRTHGGRGVAGWVTIRADGTWAAFDGH